MEAAIFSDCLTLIEQFVRVAKPEYSAFCTQWEQLRFQHIFTAQTTSLELLQTTATVFHIAKRYLCGEGKATNTQEEDVGLEALRRLGGLYLTYLVYFKQPTEKFVKLQLRQEAWCELRHLIESSRTLWRLPAQVAEEVEYIFWKLLQAGAFRFTALDNYVGLEHLVDYAHIELEVRGHAVAGGSEPHVQLRQELECCTEIQQMLPALTMLEGGYNEMKEMLAEQQTDVSNGVAVQSLPPTTIFNDIEKSFHLIQTIVGEVQSKQRPRASGRQRTRRLLKEKAYKMGVKRHRHEEADEDTDETGSASVKSINSGGDDGDDCNGGTKRSFRRMSARTVFTEKLPAHVLNDLEPGDFEEVESEEIKNAVNPKATRAKSRDEKKRKAQLLVEEGRHDPEYMDEDFHVEEASAQSATSDMETSEAGIKGFEELLTAAVRELETESDSG